MAHPPVPSLDGRLCLVTGAGSGIGRATATAAARAGARVVLTDINAAGLERTVAELGDAVAVHRALDITDLEAVRGLAEEVHATVGTLDVAINVAGIATWGAVERLTEQDWRRTVEVNLMGPIHVVECFVPAIVRAGRGGQLVNVASAAGLLALPWHAPYSASKFGLRGVSEVLRFDLHRHRIGVTWSAPGGSTRRWSRPSRSRASTRRRCSRALHTSTLPPPCRQRRVGGRADPGRHHQQPLPRLHLRRHPRPAPPRADRPAGLRAGDARLQRGVRDPARAARGDAATND